ncbi:MAG: 3-hydroxyacyl-ACP dehydratase [Bacteroidota bacterium]
MLIKDFYNTTNITFNISGFEAIIELNTNHEVYKGHFPEQPVVPGVIQLQIAKELLEDVMQAKLMMEKVTQAKYLNLITPKETPELNFIFKNSTTDDNKIKTNVNIGTSDVIFTKAKLVFKVI